VLLVFVFGQVFFHKYFNAKQQRDEKAGKAKTVGNRNLALCCRCLLCSALTRPD
jgi:hypothetical protein